MAKFSIEISRTEWQFVEANSEEEAIKKAEEMAYNSNQVVGCKCCLQECDDRDYIKYLKTFKRNGYRYLSVEEQDTIDFEEAVQSRDIKIVNNCGVLTDKGYKKTTFWYNIAKLFRRK